MKLIRILIIFALGFGAGYQICYLTRTEEGKEVRKERKEERREKLTETGEGVVDEVKERLKR